MCSPTAACFVIVCTMKHAVITSLLLMTGATGFAQGIPDIKPAEFRELQDTLLPHCQEKWQTVPWKTSLSQARDLAAKSGKPLFMWSMNGNPLGCT